MKTDIFHLQIIPIENIIPHELYDYNRSNSLANQLIKDKKICNPIIVAPISKNNFVQLDGMNRLSTLKLLGFKSIICQIIDYQDMENVDLSSWLHFINVDTPAFLKYLGKINNLIVNKGLLDDVTNRYIQSEGFDKICTIVTENCQVYLLTYGGSLIDKIKILNEIVNFYKKDLVRNVLPLSPTREDIISLFNEHLKHKQMLVYPIFTRHQILKVVRKGEFFPPGITRHVIKKRCLNVNLPLRYLKNTLSLATQNKYLEDFLRIKKFRLFEESTIYFE